MKNKNDFKVNWKDVFDPDDYLYFYSEHLEGEQLQREINFIVKELNLDKPVKILDLACGHGRHANRKIYQRL